MKHLDSETAQHKIESTSFSRRAAVEQDYSFGALTEFLQYVADHGLWKANTSIGYRTAASKVEGDLTEQEAADVRQIDLDLLFQRYMNRNKVKVAPNTLATYKRRLRKAIEEFERYREDPMSYRSQIGGNSSRAASSDATPKKKPRPKRASHGESIETPRSQSTASSTPLLTIPFPLRPDFLASVQIPRDLRKAEAERLAAFIRTLAMDGED